MEPKTVDIALGILFFGIPIVIALVCIIPDFIENIRLSREIREIERIHWLKTRCNIDDGD